MSCVESDFFPRKFYKQSQKFKKACEKMANYPKNNEPNNRCWYWSDRVCTPSRLCPGCCDVIKARILLQRQ